MEAVGALGAAEVEVARLQRDQTRWQAALRLEARAPNQGSTAVAIHTTQAVRQYPTGLEPLRPVAFLQGFSQLLVLDSFQVSGCMEPMHTPGVDTSEYYSGQEGDWTTRHRSWSSINLLYL